MDLTFTSNDVITQLRNSVCRQNRRPFSFDNIASIRNELRQRRKHLIGSFVSLEELLTANNKVNEIEAEALTAYLASRTAYLWNRTDEFGQQFCSKFYSLAIYALCSGKVGDESIDDVIQLAECLVRSRETFVTVMSSLLPEDMIATMFDLTDSFDSSYFNPTFEDAVLGAVSVFLGVLNDPVQEVPDTVERS